MKVATPCDHSRASLYYIESLLNGKAFKATKCRDYNSIKTRSCPSTGPAAFMGGEPVANGASGVYYVATGFLPPFGRG